MKSENDTIKEAMGILGSRKSEKKAKTSAENGKKGGRPKKITEDIVYAYNWEDELTVVLTQCDDNDIRSICYVDGVHSANCDSDYLDFLESEIAKMKVAKIIVSTVTESDSRDTAGGIASAYVGAKNIKQLSLELDSFNNQYLARLFPNSPKLGAGHGVVVEYNKKNIKTFWA